MNIVTGYRGEPHVTAWQDRDLNQGVFGPNTYILDVGSKLAATVISNNEIRIADGVVMMQGCQGVIQKGTYDTIAIDNGTQGRQRIDLICVQYQKSGGVESMSLVVIKGASFPTNPVLPDYTEGDIQNGDTLAQYPLYEVHIDGLTITDVERWPDVQGNFDGLRAVQAIVSNVGDTYTAETSSAVSVPVDNVYTTILTLDLPAGTYVVSFSTRWAGSSSANRDMTFAGYVLGTHQQKYIVQRPNDQNYAIGCGACICSNTYGFTVELLARQTSGSGAINVSGGISAVRIR